MRNIKPHQLRQYANQELRIFKCIFQALCDLEMNPNLSGTFYSERFNNHIVFPGFLTPEDKESLIAELRKHYDSATNWMTAKV